MKLFLRTLLVALVHCVTCIIARVRELGATNALPGNCNDVLAGSGLNHVASGIYTIYPTNRNASGAEVFCDMDTSEGGWTVIQRRRETDDEGSQIGFIRNWTDYVEGFGSLQDSHWLGLDLISILTNTERCKLRVDMMDWDGEERFAEYAAFQLSNSSDEFRITINGYSGDAGDSLAYHNTMQFSTIDRDNDCWGSGNCARMSKGGWWYRSCMTSNLNGVYGSLEFRGGISWDAWPGPNYTLKRVEMKIQSVK